MYFIKSSFYQKNNLQSLYSRVNFTGITEIHIELFDDFTEGSVILYILVGWKTLFVHKNNLG